MIKPERTMPRHTVIKMAKLKTKEERILKKKKKARKKAYYIKGTPIKLSVVFFSKTLETRR